MVAGQASWDCYTPNDRASKCDDVGPGSVDSPANGMGSYMGTSFNQAQSRSRHNHGVNAAMCDGSVRFFPETMTPATWFSIGSRNDGLSWSAD